VERRLPRLEDYPGRTASGTKPLLSIVTTVRNGEKTLARTFDSVRAQAMPHLEYVVTDAGSTDGTHDIIAAYSDIVSYWQSENDRGISDGFNKSIALTTGKYVAILNADDWLSPGQLAFGVDTLEKTGADFVFGDLIYHDGNGAALYRVRGEADYARRIGHVMPALNHPSVIVRRTAYERHGLFDLNLRLAMDYEFLLRLHRADCTGIYDPRILGHMSLEGASDAQSRRALAEVRDIAIRHGGSPLREWRRYIFHLAKSDVRKLIEKLLPQSIARRLRSAVNGNFADLTR
jgi:glycosyltransferase involved in cell wall biosynthesis